MAILYSKRKANLCFYEISVTKLAVMLWWMLLHDTRFLPRPSAWNPRSCWHHGDNRSTRSGSPLHRSTTWTNSAGEKETGILATLHPWVFTLSSQCKQIPVTGLHRCSIIINHFLLFQWAKKFVKTGLLLTCWNKCNWPMDPEIEGYFPILTPPILYLSQSCYI